MMIKSKLRLSAAALTSCLVYNSIAAENENTNNPNPECTLYLAPSTIPNAGLGIFSSISIPEGARLPGGGDGAVPITDLDFHNDGSFVKEDYHWLFSEYTWSARSFGKQMVYEAETTSGWSWGHGALPNCHFRMNNVNESLCEFDTVNLTPKNSPGAGAFTGYHNRVAYASDDIRAGSELFVNYGPTWFTTREDYMGLVPAEKDFEVGEGFVERLSKMFESLMAVRDTINITEVQGDIWNIIINFPYKSRPLAALPRTFQAAIRATEVGITQTEEELATHSIEYLEKHGKCLDHIQPQNSTIPHAGRGAFATRFLPRGTVVSTAPLLHIPDRDILTMYDDDMLEEQQRDKSKPIGQQLLLNYCWGHASSSMLLCPYSHGTPFINHDGQDPNVKIRWMEHDELYHNSSWLNEPVTFFDSVWTTKLMFEYVALRDIQQGEEVLVDYGSEWEEAWRGHVEEWEPDDNYVSPYELNSNYDVPLKIDEEDESSMYEQNHIEGYYRIKKGEEREIHRITARRPAPNNKVDGDGYVYDLEILSKGNQLKLVENVPRSRMRFFHEEYQSDMFREGAFRHEMMIPDEMFPSAWRNLE